MRLTIKEALLREYVKTVLNEDDAGGNPAYGGGGDIGLGAGSPYGVSFGSGQDLIDSFITPFVDVFKTAVGKTKEITRKASTVLWVALQTVLTTLIPIYGYNYSDVFDKEKQDIEKIRSKYKDVYDRTDKALASSDAGMLAFMANPAVVLGAKFAAVATPKAAEEAKDLLSAATGGFSDSAIDSVASAYKKAGRWAVGDAGEIAPSKGPGKKTPSAMFGEAQLHEKAGKKSPMTLSKVVRSKKFLNHVFASPEAQAMQKQAQAIYKRTLKEVYDQAEELLKSTKTVEGLEKAAKGKIKGDMKSKVDEVKKLPPEEKKKAEEMLVKGVKKAMKEFYVKNLTDHVKKVMDAGIPADAQYVKDYKSVIQKIQSL